jgi:hypothetical protein
MPMAATVKDHRFEALECKRCALRKRFFILLGGNHGRLCDLVLSSTSGNILIKGSAKTKGLKPYDYSLL